MDRVEEPHQESAEEVSVEPQLPLVDRKTLAVRPLFYADVGCLPVTVVVIALVDLGGPSNTVMAVL